MFTNAKSTIVRTLVGTAGVALCAGLCLVGATAPAFAGTIAAQAAAGRTINVSYADLDLANAAGRATLDRRIDAAARAVCGTNNSGPDAAMDELRCTQQAAVAAKAKAAAVAQRSVAL